MIVNQISSVFKYAVNTFTALTRNQHEIFQQNLSLLRQSLNSITADDVGFKDKYLTLDYWSQPNQAPVSYIEIFEDTAISIGIFILRPGMRLPLHDHPNMYGLLKVIAGTVQLNSFSIEEDYLTHTKATPLVIDAIENPSIILNKDSPCCVLEPFKGNLHEIVSVGGPAAFIDVLSPPYGTSIDGNITRKCRFFQKESIKAQHVKLIEVKSPWWYWTNREEYCGPSFLDSTEY